MNPSQHSVTVNNTKYNYTLSKPFKKYGEKVTQVVCKAAAIDQIFATEDIPALLIDLPNLIIAEKKYEEKQNEMIRFRVSTEEKKKIEQKAVKKGFPTVSDFLRTLALQP